MSVKTVHNLMYLILSVVFSVFILGASPVSKHETDLAVVGTGTGAVIGAIIGKRLDGDRGAAIGIFVGGLLGNQLGREIGRSYDKSDKNKQPIANPGYQP